MLHSKKNPLTGKPKQARKPSRKPFSVSERVSDLIKGVQKNPFGFRDLGNLRVFESTEFDPREVS